MNVIVPGAFPSEMTGAPGGSDERGHVSMEGREALWDDVPAKRPGMEREMAGLGTFLARCQTPLSVFVDTYVQSCWRVFEWCCYCCRRWTSPSETECFLIPLAPEFHSLRSPSCVSVPFILIQRLPVDFSSFISCFNHHSQTYQLPRGETLLRHKRIPKTLIYDCMDILMTKGITTPYSLTI